MASISSHSMVLRPKKRKATRKSQRERRQIEHNPIPRSAVYADYTNEECHPLGCAARGRHIAAEGLQCTGTWPLMVLALNRVACFVRVVSGSSSRAIASVRAESVANNVLVSEWPKLRKFWLDHSSELFPDDMEIAKQFLANVEIKRDWSFLKGAYVYQTTAATHWLYFVRKGYKYTGHPAGLCRAMKIKVERRHFHATRRSLFGDTTERAENWSVAEDFVVLKTKERGLREDTLVEVLKRRKAEVDYERLTVRFGTARALVAEDFDHMLSTAASKFTNGRWMTSANDGKRKSELVSAMPLKKWYMFEKWARMKFALVWGNVEVKKTTDGKVTAIVASLRRSDGVHVFGENTRKLLPITVPVTDNADVKMDDSSVVDETSERPSLSRTTTIAQMPRYKQMFATLEITDWWFRWSVGQCHVSAVVAYWNVNNIRFT